MDPFNLKASLRALAASKRQEPASFSEPKEEKDPIRKLGNKIQTDIVEEAPPGLLERAGGTALSGLATVGNLLDLPGSMVRDTLSWLPGGPKPQNPFDQLASPFTHHNRLTGRDLMRGYGLAGKDDTMLNFLGGLGAEIALDPLSYLTFGGAALTKGGRAARALNVENRAKDVATKLLGRKVGRREARHVVTPRMLIEDVGANLAADNRLDKRFRDMGVDDAAMDRPLGGLARISIPFTDKPFTYNKKPFTFWGLTDEEGIIGGGRVKGRGRDIYPLDYTDPIDGEPLGPGRGPNPPPRGPAPASQTPPPSPRGNVPPDPPESPRQGLSGPAPTQPGPVPPTDVTPTAPAPQTPPSIDPVVSVRPKGSGELDIDVEIPNAGIARASVEYASDAAESPRIFLNQFDRLPQAKAGTGRAIINKILEASKDSNPGSISGAFDSNVALGAFGSVFGRENVIFHDRVTGEALDIPFSEAMKDPKKYVATHEFNKPVAKVEPSPAAAIPEVEPAAVPLVDDITPQRREAINSSLQNLEDMVFQEGANQIDVLDNIEKHVEFGLDGAGLDSKLTPDESRYVRDYSSVFAKPAEINELVSYAKQRIDDNPTIDPTVEAERIFNKFGRFDLEDEYYSQVLGKKPAAKQQKPLIEEDVTPEQTPVEQPTITAADQQVAPQSSPIQDTAKIQPGLFQFEPEVVKAAKRGKKAKEKAAEQQVAKAAKDSDELKELDTKLAELERRREIFAQKNQNENGEFLRKADAKQYEAMHKEIDKLDKKYSELYTKVYGSEDGITPRTPTEVNAPPTATAEITPVAQSPADQIIPSSAKEDPARVKAAKSFTDRLSQIQEDGRPKYGPKEIEIARAMAMGNIDGAVSQIKNFNDLGIGLSMDLKKLGQRVNKNRFIDDAQLASYESKMQEAIADNALKNYDLMNDTPASIGQSAMREQYATLDEGSKQFFSGPKHFGDYVTRRAADLRNKANEAAKEAERLAKSKGKGKLKSEVAPAVGIGQPPSIVDMRTLEGLPEQAKPIVGEMITKIGQKLFDDVKLQVGGDAVKSTTAGDIDMATGFISIYNTAIKNGTVDKTTVHEFWHHLSKYISPNEVRAVRNEFELAVDAFKKAEGNKQLPYELSSVDEFFAHKLTDLSMKYLGREKPVDLIGKVWAKALDAFEFIWDAIRQSLGYDQTKKIMSSFLNGHRVEISKYTDATMTQRLMDELDPKDVLQSTMKQTQTKEFKDWFGDWEKDPKNASKVVDADGKPLVVYHGTRHSDLGLSKIKDRNKKIVDQRNAADEWEVKYGSLREELNKQQKSIQSEIDSVAKKHATKLSPNRFSVDSLADDIATYTQFGSGTASDFLQNIGRNFRLTGAPPDSLLLQAYDELMPLVKKYKDVEGRLGDIPARKSRIDASSKLQPETVQFDTKRFGENDEGYLSAGTYFTADKNLASDYATFGEGAGVIPAYINLRNPFIHGVSPSEPVDKLVNELYEQGAQSLRNARADVDEYSRLRATARRDALIRLGYDGEIYDSKVAGKSNAFADSEIVAFYPEQIKSATGNRGTFDPKSGNILESQADPILPNEEIAKQLSDFRSAKIAKGMDQIGDRVMDTAVARQLTAMFDQSVLGQISKVAQEAARPAFKAYREGVLRERDFMSDHLRTWYDTANLREDVIVKEELPSLDEYIAGAGGDRKLAAKNQMIDARKIQNQRVNEIRRILERSIFDQDGNVIPNALQVDESMLPAWVGREKVGGRILENPERRTQLARMLTSFNQKKFNMIRDEHAAGINTSRLDGYYPRIKPDLPGSFFSLWNPNYGKLLDPTHPHQKRRKDFLVGYEDGTSVIQDISVDPMVSGIHSKKKVREEPKPHEIKIAATQIWDKYRDRLFPQFAEKSLDELLPIKDGLYYDKLQALAKEIIELDPRHVEYQIPMFSNDLFSGFELRLEHHHRSIMQARVIRDMLRKNVVSRDMLGSVNGVTLEKVLEGAKYNNDLAVPIILRNIPREQLLAADKQFWATEIQPRIDTAVKRYNELNQGRQVEYVDPDGRRPVINETTKVMRFPAFFGPVKKGSDQYDLVISVDDTAPELSFAYWDVSHDTGSDVATQGIKPIPDPRSIPAGTIADDSTPLGYQSPHPPQAILNRLAVSNEVADALTKFVQGPRVLEEMKPMIRGYDKATNMWKMMQTGMLPFLSFHGRNLGSGQASNFYLGIQNDPRFSKFSLTDPDTWLNPIKRFTAPIADAHRLATGQTVPGISDAPLFRDLGMTDDVATERLRRRAYAQGVTGEKQGLSAEQLTDTVGTAASQYPGLDPSKAINPLAWKWSEPVPESTFAQRWLMPWMSKGVIADKDIFRPGQLGRDLGAYTESLNRLAPFIAMIRQGYDPRAAADMVNRAQVDYTNMSNFNREYTRRLFPFASYTLGMAPTVFRELTERPGGGMARTVMATTQAGQTAEQGVTPDYIRETASIPLGMSEDGTRSYITGFGLPFEDPLQFAQLARGNVSGLLRELGSRMNPVPKSLIEMMTGRSLYQAGPFGGREIEDLDPTIGRIIANVNDLVTGEKTERAQPFIGPWAEYAISNAGPGRMLNTIRTATDPRKWDVVPWKLALNLGTGVRVADVSPSAQDAILRERIARIMKDFGGRMYSRPYFPDYASENWTPEEAEDAAKIEALMKLLNRRATDRRRQE